DPDRRLEPRLRAEAGPARRRRPRVRPRPRRRQAGLAHAARARDPHAVAAAALDRAVRYLAIVLAACADLPPAVPTTCGHGVLEPERGEDCDGAASPVAGTCGAPGTLHECRYLCAPSCPAGWGCEPTGICRPATGAFAELTAVSPIDMPSDSFA